MLGVVTMVYIQQVMFRRSYYFDTVLYYIKLLSDDERKQLV